MLPSLTLALLLLPAQGDATKAKADGIASFVGEEVAAILHADFSAIDFERDVRAMIGPLAEERGMPEALAAGAKVVNDLKDAGAKDAYILIDPLDLPGVPTIVMTGAKNPNALRDALQGMLPQNGPPFTVEVIRGAVVAGSPQGLARVRLPLPARPGLVEAYAATGDAPARAILLPSTAQRRALEEALPELPAEIGGGSIAPFSEGLKWGVFALRVKPKPSLHVLLQADKPESAKEMHAILTRVLDAIKKQAASGPPQVGAFATLLRVFKPELKGDQITAEVGAEEAIAMIAEPIKAAREAARRAQCTNNLKQIGLAMHNYLSSYNNFPAAYSKTKDGKPGLSWRVHILPFLEQQALYQQFHLDEPWDSEHNKTLIEQMPMTYACPDSIVVSEHKTVYVGPRGEATILAGDVGTKIQDVTDGTSNTIMVLETNDENAVIWTKPDDWETGDKPNPKDLTGLHSNGGFNALFTDGSVRFIKDTIDLLTFKALLTRNGGEVIAFDKLD